MIWIVLVVILLACVYLPGLWVRRIMRKYAAPEDRYREQGTGAELARHLLDRFDLANVKVEETEIGDHYDPEAQAVRLTPDNFGKHSLTAVTVAAHEVGRPRPGLRAVRRAA